MDLAQFSEETVDHIFNGARRIDSNGLGQLVGRQCQDDKSGLHSGLAEEFPGNGGWRDGGSHATPPNDTADHHARLC